MNQLTQAQFEDKLSFWVNGSLPKSEAEEMKAFLEANPDLNGMYKLELLTQKGVNPLQSPLTTDESWAQLQMRWRRVLDRKEVDGIFSNLKRWFRIEGESRKTGWQVGFSFAVAVCVIQAVALLQLSRNAETPWSETRSGNTKISYNIRAKPLPQSPMSAVLANIHATEVEIVGGPNGDGELLMLSTNALAVNQAIEKLSASSLFEYVLIVKTQKEVQP